MADDIRLYMLQSGILETFEKSIKMNASGDRYDIPVPWYVVTHPRGTVVFDGGNASACVSGAREHWGDICDVYNPVLTEEQTVLGGLASIGVDPASVTHVVQSHLHLDHTGALADYASFPNAKAVCTRAEFEYGHAPDWFAAAGYIQADYADPSITWELLDERDDGWDLFGDGVIRLWQTPGHAPGHQSFEITLPNSGSILLTVDAAYTTDHWNEQALPGFLASTVDTVRSVKKLHRIAARSGSTVVTGHDPDAWPSFKQAPEFYD